jgi:hypothetical protein
MSLAPGTVPIAIGIVVAVVAFLGWFPLALRHPREAASGAVDATVHVVAPAATPAPVSVRAVLRPQYRVAAPDEAAVRAALLLRVRPPVPLPVDAERAPVPVSVPLHAGLARSA